MPRPMMTTPAMMMIPMRVDISMRMEQTQEQVQVQEQHLAFRAALRLYSVLRRNFEFAEVWIGLLSFAFGIFLLLPFDSLDTAPAFMVMRQLAPEWAWGVWLLSSGVAQIGGLAVNHRRLRMLAGLSSFFLWCFVSLLVIIANPRAPAVVIYPGLAAAAGWSFLRIGYHRGNGNGNDYDNDDAQYGS